MKKCTHKGTWLICGGYGEWCYVCGAFRGMKPIESEVNAVTNRTTWVRPTGDIENNPFKKMRNLNK